MLLGEPPRSGGDLHFSLFGIPVRIHPFFWVIAALLGINSTTGTDQPLVILLIWIAAVLISILIHELGHALAMRMFGLRPWITLYSFGGLASYDPSEGRHISTGGNVWISFAGPLAQFILAAAILGVLFAVGYELSLWQLGPLYLILPSGGETVVSWGLTELINDLITVSVLWGILNLMPVYPLDGGHIARELLVAANPRDGIRQSLTLSIAAAVAMALVAVLLMGSIYMAVMFGLMGYGSYATLQRYRDQRGW